MSKITEIENAIISLGPGEFQKFCDAFLYKSGKYGKILGLGMKSGTLKTTIGNPDTYFRNDNGKYILVAYTNQQNGIYTKLKDDIGKCLDPVKTKLPIEEIDEIICCHTSSNLTAGDDLKLHKMCEEKGIELTIFGVDEIAQQVYNHFPILAKDILGISIDTNQIMRVEEFISLYDSNEMAAPLNTQFLGRKDDLPKIVETLKERKVTIVYGPAGTGKTRITLEAIRKFSEEEGFYLLCVKNNNQSLYDDLVARIDSPGNYLFFVDDANELAGLEHIVQYVGRNSNDYNFKIIVTVRDYAKDSVVKIVNRYTKPEMIALKAFSDAEIKEFLAINMGITNNIYTDQIVKIAEGNPRIAYMAGKIAREKQNLSSVHDASQVYEQYYAEIIETRFSENRELFLTAGILALVNAVVLNKLDIFENLLKSSNLTKDTFVESIHKLARIEVVEIHKDRVAAISEQCLSNYLLYYIFFQRKEIPFSEVLYVGYKFFKNGVIRSLNVLFNIFAKEEVRDYFSNEVKVVWERYEAEKAPEFDDFVVTFHTFRPEESFIIAQDKICKIKPEEVDGRTIDFDKCPFNSDDNILGLLSGYEHTSYMKTVVELLLEYAGKSRDKAVLAYNFLKNTYGIDQDSYRYNFYVQKEVCTALNRYLGENTFVLRCILAIVGEYLKYEFRPTELGRRNTFVFYHLQINNNEHVREYRALCWQIVKRLKDKEEIRDDIEEFLRQYAISIRTASDSSVVENDKVYIEDILKGIELSNIRRALIVRDLQYGWKRKDVKYISDNKLFNTQEWVLLSILDNDFFYSDLEYQDYQKVHEERLNEYAIELSVEDIEYVIRTAASIARESCFKKKKDKRYTIASSLTQMSVVISNNYEKTRCFFVALMEYADELEVYPGYLMRTLLSNMSAKDVLVLIAGKDFKNKNMWKFYLFEQLPDNMVSEDIYQDLVDYISEGTDKDIVTSSYRNLRLLDKFISIDENVYVNVSRIILKKIEYNPFIVQMYFALLFNEHVFTPEEVEKYFKSDISLLKEIYFFMLKNNDIDDLKGNFLIHFLSLSDDWLEEYSNEIAEMINSGRERDKEYYSYSALWRADGYIKYYDHIYNKLVDVDGYFSAWRIGNALKTILSHGQNDSLIIERQEEWVMHVIENNAHEETIIALFAGLAEGTTELRRKALFRFLEVNDNYEMFEKLPLDPNHWGGNVDEIIPQLTRRIEFLESLLPRLTEVRYLRHSKRVKDRIEMWRAQIREEELENICRNLYQ